MQEALDLKLVEEQSTAADYFGSSADATACGPCNVDGTSGTWDLPCMVDGSAGDYWQIQVKLPREDSRGSRLETFRKPEYCRRLTDGQSSRLLWHA